MIRLERSEQAAVAGPAPVRGPGRRCARAAGALLLLASVGACAPAVREVRAPVAVPERFGAEPAGMEGQPLPDRWWLAFGDPVLEALVAHALEGNLDLRGAWDRLAQAEAVAHRSGAERLPAVDGEAEVSRSRSYERRNGAWRTDAGTGWSLGLVAGYEVDLWGRVRSVRDAAELDRQTGEAELRAAAVTLSAEVASAWYELVEQYGQLDLLGQQLATNDQVRELTTLRFRRGQVGAADVLQQRQLVESKRGEQARVQARVAVLEHRLAVLLGAPPQRSPVPVLAGRVTELTALPPLPETGLPSALIRRRPDVRRAFYAVAAADRRVAAALADRYPALSLSARLSTSADQVGDLFRNWLATFAANLLGPVFDGGQRQAEVERTRAVAAEQLHRYGQAVLEAFGEVEDALAGEARQRQFIESLDKQLELAALVSERVRDRYAAGGEDYLRVLDALLTQQQLQRTRLTAERDLVLERIALCRALAGGWELDRPAEPAQAASKSATGVANPTSDETRGYRDVPDSTL